MGVCHRAWPVQYWGLNPMLWVLSRSPIMSALGQLSRHAWVTDPLYVGGWGFVRVKGVGKSFLQNSCPPLLPAGVRTLMDLKAPRSTAYMAQLGSFYCTIKKNQIIWNVYFIKRGGRGNVGGMWRGRWSGNAVLSAADLSVSSGTSCVPEQPFRPVWLWTGSHIVSLDILEKRAFKTKTQKLSFF